MAYSYILLWAASNVLRIVEGGARELRLYILLRTVVRISKFPEHHPFQLRGSFWVIIRIGLAHKVLIGIVSPLTYHPIPCYSTISPLPPTAIKPYLRTDDFLTRYISVLNCPFFQSLQLPSMAGPSAYPMVESALLCSVLPFLTHMIACYLSALALFSCSAVLRQSMGSRLERLEGPDRLSTHHGPSSAIKVGFGDSRILHENCLAC